MEIQLPMAVLADGEDARPATKVIPGTTWAAEPDFFRWLPTKRTRSAFSPPHKVKKVPPMHASIDIFPREYCIVFFHFFHFLIGY